MPRPRTALGTFGKIAVTGHARDSAGRLVRAPEGTRPTDWRARTKFRDWDGKTREVERWSPTKAKAETMLKRALADREAPAKNSGLRSDMSLEAAADSWLTKVNRPDSGLAESTAVQYRGHVDRYVRAARSRS